MFPHRGARGGGKTNNAILEEKLKAQSEPPKDRACAPSERLNHLRSAREHLQSRNSTPITDSWSSDLLR
jgi:hypothetical protein